MASTNAPTPDQLISATPSAEDPTVIHTVIALFDDIIDAEHALSALRKSDQPSEQISVILRERVLSENPSIRHQTILSRVVASSALEAVGGWLQGLASLILPDRASYLVAGPIGAVLATIRESRPSNASRQIPDRRTSQDTSRQLALALAAFGFSREESQYLEQRVVAGSPLIGITSADAETLRSAHGAFSTHTAVHLGLARTESSINRTAARLLLTGPQTGGSVVIADAISPLHRLSESMSTALRRIDFRGREVVSMTGESLGKVSDVLFERRIPDDPGAVSPSTGRPEIARYLLLRIGGVRRLARQHVAIPTERVAEVTSSRIVLSATKRVVQEAPRFDELAPMSRQDEVRICTHFDVPQYWIRDQPAKPAPPLV